MIHRIKVTIEGLHTQSTSDVPEGYGLISRPRCEYVGVGLEGYMVHGVHVTAERVPHPPRPIEVEQLTRVVHTRGHEELTSVVELDCPNGLDVVLECMRT
jgi:hypothetical protein